MLGPLEREVVVHVLGCIYSRGVAEQGGPDNRNPFERWDPRFSQDPRVLGSALLRRFWISGSEGLGPLTETLNQAEVEELMSSILRAALSPSSILRDTGAWLLVMLAKEEYHLTGGIRQMERAWMDRMDRLIIGRSFIEEGGEEEGTRKKKGEELEGEEEERDGGVKGMKEEVWADQGARSRLIQSLERQICYACSDSPEGEERKEEGSILPSSSTSSGSYISTSYPSPSTATTLTPVISTSDSISTFSPPAEETKGTPILLVSAPPSPISGPTPSTPVTRRTTFYSQCKRLLDASDTFLNLLLHVRSLPESGDEFEEERILATLRLLSFVRDIDVEPLYLRYVHSLVQVQLRARNYTEAALSLIRLYADRLPWRVDGPKLPAAPGLGFPYAQSSFERRETLLLRALALATEGQAWELGMSIAKELAHQYAHTVYDYGRLAGMLRTEATLAERIVTQDRFPCVYFRVAYWGTGFPQGLRGRQYICRGRPWEQLGAFCERLQRRHPAARLLRSSGAPSEHVRQGGGGAQYVQVTVVTPEPDKPEALNILSKGDFVPPAIAAYWERNEVRKFSYSRPFRRLESSSAGDGGGGGGSGGGIGLGNGHDRGSSRMSVSPAYVAAAASGGLEGLIPTESEQYLGTGGPGQVSGARELLDVWTERTTLHTEDTFPSVLRRAEVVRVEVRELSPLENAVEAVQERNRELRSMERKYGAHLVLGPDATEDDLGRVQGAVNCQPLTMTLNAAVNPAPHAGGAMMYREAFLSRRYVLANLAQGGDVRELRGCIDEQVEIISRCLGVHERLITPDLTDLHENLVHYFHLHFGEEIRRISNRLGRSLRYTPPTMMMGVFDGRGLGEEGTGDLGGREASSSSLGGGGGGNGGGGRASFSSARSVFNIFSGLGTSSSSSSSAISPSHPESSTSGHLLPALQEEVGVPSHPGRNSLHETESVISAPELRASPSTHSPRNSGGLGPRPSVSGAGGGSGGLIGNAWKRLSMGRSTRSTEDVPSTARPYPVRGGTYSTTGSVTGSMTGSMTSSIEEGSYSSATLSDDGREKRGGGERRVSRRWTLRWKSSSHSGSSVDE